MNHKALLDSVQTLLLVCLYYIEFRWSLVKCRLKSFSSQSPISLTDCHTIVRVHIVWCWKEQHQLPGIKAVRPKSASRQLLFSISLLKGLKIDAGTALWSWLEVLLLLSNPLFCSVVLWRIEKEAGGGVREQRWRLWDWWRYLFTPSSWVWRGRQDPAWNHAAEQNR